MKPPLPSAPFSNLKTRGEYILLEVSCTNLILPTGNIHLLPLHNEYVLAEGRTLSDGTHVFTDDYDCDTGLQNLLYPWIAAYDSSNDYVDFFIFTYRPKQFKYVVSSGIITQIYLYPGEGIVSNGRVRYPNLTTDTNGDLIPDFLTMFNHGSLPSFLQTYSCEEKLPEQDQYLLSDGSELLTSTGEYLFFSRSSENVAVSNSLTVDDTKSLGKVPIGFVGFSMEPSDICNFIQNASTYSTKFQNLFSNLGSSIIRFGGNTGDAATWEPQGTASCGYSSVFNQTLITNIFSIVSDYGWKATWQINLAANDPGTYSNEAEYVSSVAGSTLYGIEMGNEPEYFVSHSYRSSYDYATYSSEWDSYKSSIDPDIPLVGPSSGVGAWNSNFANGHYSDVDFLTCHIYPTVVGGTGLTEPTITNLLGTALTTSTRSRIQTLAGYADAVDKKLIINESNSVAAGGASGVSNSLAAAFWAIDFMFTALSLGIHKINFHGAFSDAVYAPLDVTGTPLSLYYAMLVFHQVAPNGDIISVSSNITLNVKTYSVIGADGKLRIVIVNKSENDGITLKIKTNSVFTSATAIFLTASGGLTATSGFTLGGTSVAEDGSWTSGTPDTLTVEGNYTEITVPLANTAIVTFSY